MLHSIRLVSIVLLLNHGHLRCGNVRRFRLDHFINQPIIQRFVRRHEKVSIRIFRNLLFRLTAVLRHVLVEARLDEQNLLGLDFNICRGSLCPSEGLVDHDTGIGQGLALPRSTGTQQKGSHTRRHSETDSLNVARDELHRIVNGKSSTNGATGRVDVESNVLVGVVVSEVEELSDKDVRDFVVDVSSEQENSILEEARDDIQLT